MKKNYETPTVEKIEFDYSDAVVASNGKRTYMQSNEWYECHSSIVPDNCCGYHVSGGAQVSNADYNCGE